jgi:hypothetical protein
MISARDELLHVVETLSPEECELYLSAPEMAEVLRRLVRLVDNDPRGRMYDTALNEVVDRARAALPGGE